MDVTELANCVRQNGDEEVVLKDFIASSSENVLDYTMKRKSKRYDTRPGTKKDDVLNVAIGIDTSGSIDEEMLKMFFNELRWIDKSCTTICSIANAPYIRLHCASCTR